MSEEHRLRYFGKPEKSRYYPFYEVKDGDDCLKKTLMVSLYTGSAGTLFAFFNGFTSTTIDNPALGSNLLIRFGKFAVPMFAAGAVYSATVCAVSNIQGGKDSPLNHFCGGMAAGSVFGTAFKSHKLGWGLAFLFGSLAALRKQYEMEGFSKINDVPTRRQTQMFLGSHQRSFLTSRPDAEGDQSL